MKSKNKAKQYHPLAIGGKCKVQVKWQLVEDGGCRKKLKDIYLAHKEIRWWAEKAD